MSELKTTTASYWTSTQAFALATVSLVLGVCGGMLVRRASTRTITPQAIVPAAPVPASFGSVGAAPSAKEMKQAADQQAAPRYSKN